MFVVLGSALTVVPAVGLYQFLRPAGSTTTIALAAFVTGSLFVFVHSLIELGLGYELIPEHANAVEEARPALEVVGRTLHVTRVFALVAGNLFAFGVGIALFAFASIRSATTPTWLAWLGLAVDLTVQVQCRAIQGLSVFRASPRSAWRVGRGGFQIRPCGTGAASVHDHNRQRHLHLHGPDAVSGDNAAHHLRRPHSRSS